MLYTITFDANGDPQGFSRYSDESLAPNPLPAGEVQCTASQFANWQNYVLANAQIVDAPASKLLAFAQAEQIPVLTKACAAAIVSGFSSSALGSTCNYPSTLTDQANQNTVANCATGGSLWCESSGAWSFAQHTQDQAKAVVASFSAWLNKCQQQLVTLTAQVNSASTVASVQAVTWENPTQ